MHKSVEGEEFTIFSYSTSHLEYKDKIRFYYALKGRDGKSGIINDYKIEQLGKTVLFVKLNQVEDVRQFLNQWKCEYHTKEVVVKNS